MQDLYGTSENERRKIVAANVKGWPPILCGLVWLVFKTYQPLLVI